jgi:hypothetical protein
MLKPIFLCSKDALNYDKKTFCIRIQIVFYVRGELSLTHGREDVK